MSASSGMGAPSWNDVRGGRSEARHQAMDRFERGLAEFARQVRVDGGRARTFVPEILLDELKSDARFQEVGGVAVAKRVHVGSLVDAGMLDCAHEGTLQTRARDRTAGDILGRGEEPERVAMRAPVLAQECEQGVRERHESVVGTLAVNMEECDHGRRPAPGDERLP